MNGTQSSGRRPLRRADAEGGRAVDRRPGELVLRNAARRRFATEPRASTRQRKAGLASRGCPGVRRRDSSAGHGGRERVRRRGCLVRRRPASHDRRSDLSARGRMGDLHLAGLVRRRLRRPAPAVSREQPDDALRAARRRPGSGGVPQLEVAPLVRFLSVRPLRSGRSEHRGRRSSGQDRARSDRTVDRRSVGGATGRAARQPGRRPGVSVPCHGKQISLSAASATLGSPVVLPDSPLAPTSGAHAWAEGTCPHPGATPATTEVCAVWVSFPGSGLSVACDQATRVSWNRVGVRAASSRAEAATGQVVHPRRRPGARSIRRNRRRGLSGADRPRPRRYPGRRCRATTTPRCCTIARSIVDRSRS